MQAAWDSGIMNYYAPEARARLPIAMKPGDSLASSISLKQGEKVTYPYHAGTVRGVEDNSPVKTIAVLTCVAGPLPPDAFRPGYSGHDTRIYLARDLKRDLLPHFAQPADAPDPVKFAERVQRPWCDAGFFSFDVPQNSMPNYAQAYAQCVADAILLACCDGTRPEDRKRLVIAIIQIGIDHYGLGALRGKPPCAWQSSPCLPHGRPLGIWPSCPGALPDRPRIVYGALRGRPHDIRPIRPGVPGGRPHLFPGARRGRLLAV